jgi:AraC-like DNA-binding protein
MDIVYASSPLEGMEVLSCCGAHPFANHLHDGYVLWLNSESGEHFSLNGISDILSPGAIAIIEPGVIHANHPCLPERRHLRSFYFTEKFFHDLYEKISGGGSAVPELRTCVLEDPLLWRQFIDLHETLFGSKDILGIETAAVSSFFALSRRCGSKELPGGIHLKREARLETIIDFFHGNIAEQISLQELADMVQCGSYHLIRLFREQIGMSPHAYLVQLRLEHARKMLEKGESIAEAALSSGFSDQSHLTRKFKFRFGVSPGVYQKQRFRHSQPKKLRK